MKKKNDWFIPQSMLVGAGLVLVSMIIPQVRSIVVKGTAKVGSMVGLE